MATDTRIKVTRLLLNEALIEILGDKPIHKVTVKEICEKADMNRSTYYAHYDNPYDQFQKIKDEFIEKGNRYIGTCEKVGKTISLYERTVILYQMFLENKKLFLVILRASGFNEVIDLFTEPYKNEVFRQWEKDFHFKDRYQDMLLDFFFAGFLRITYDWLDQKSGYLSPEEMAEVIVSLYKKTIDTLNRI